MAPQITQPDFFSSQHAETYEFKDLAAALPVPDKATCTVQEAKKVLGVSESQIKNWIADGTLLAINAARQPVSGMPRRVASRDRWRIVVKRRDYSGADYDSFWTLEELIQKISNINTAN